MDVNEAVLLAKSYFNDVFSNERIAELGLEEVVFEEEDQSWRITLGFTRPWPDAMLQHLAVRDALNLIRDYKVVAISDRERKVLSVRNRERLDG